MTGTRIDKWLWAARFFKTRALAAKACDLGRIRSNGHDAKPAREVRLGDSLEIKNEAGTYVVEVLVLSETRGPAAVAQTLFAESGTSKEARAKAQAERKLMATLDPTFNPRPAGRPGKRDRRLIHRFSSD